MVRKSAFIAAAVLFATIHGSFGAELLAHWDFNDLKDNQFIDRVSGLKASGPEGMDLNEFQTPGPDGTAFHFIGKNPLKVEHHPAIDLKNDFTLELVFKSDNTRRFRFRCIFWKGDRTKIPEQVNYYIGICNGKVEFKAKGPKGKWVTRICSGKIEDGEWNHLLMHWKDGKLNAKLNNVYTSVKENDGEDISGELVSTPTSGFFGQGATGKRPAFFFSGELDDFKIWQGDAMGNRIGNWDQKLKTVKELVEQRKEKERKEAEKSKEELTRKIAAFCGNQRYGYAVVPVARRVLDLKDLFSKPFSQKAEMELAQNETETIQLILLNAPSAENEVKNITVSDLSGPDRNVIPASAIKAGEAGFVTTEEPEFPVDFVGPIPDVIFTGKTDGVIPANGIKIYTLRISSGQTPAGIYSGTVTVSLKEGVIKIPLSVRVWDFSLPKRMTLRNAFCFFEHFYRDWYGCKTLTKEQRFKIYEFLLDYRLNPCNIYSAANYPSLDDVKELHDRMNFMTFRAFNRMSLNETVENYKATIRKVKDLNFEDYLYCYSYDELGENPRHIPSARKTLKLLREAIPGLKCMQTSFPWPSIRNIFNIWCPLLTHFSDPVKRAIMEDLRIKEGEIWWYWADDPIKPMPNFFLDYPVFDCRIIGIMSHKYRIKGILYWCINREWQTNMEIRKEWPAASWKPWICNINTKKRVYKNGMGNLVYPGKNGELLPSLRLENLRDGIEDYEYLAILSRKAAALPAEHPLRKEAEALLKVPASVAESVTRYSADPENLQAYRKAVAEMIVKIKGKGTSK